MDNKEADIQRIMYEHNVGRATAEYVYTAMEQMDRRKNELKDKLQTKKD